MGRTPSAAPPSSVSSRRAAAMACSANDYSEAVICVALSRCCHVPCGLVGVSGLLAFSILDVVDHHSLMGTGSGCITSLCRVACMHRFCCPGLLCTVSTALSFKAVSTCLLRDCRASIVFPRACPVQNRSRVQGGQHLPHERLQVGIWESVVQKKK